MFISLQIIHLSSRPTDALKPPLLEGLTLAIALGFLPMMGGPSHSRTRVSPLSLTTKCICAMLSLGAPLILKLDQSNELVSFSEMTQYHACTMSINAYA